MTLFWGGGGSRGDQVTTVLQHHTLVQVSLRRPQISPLIPRKEHSHILENHWHLRSCCHLFNSHSVFPASFLCKGTESPECRSPPGLWSSSGEKLLNCPSWTATSGRDYTQMRQTSGLAGSCSLQWQNSAPLYWCF